jgi:hypothetical protein
MTQEEVMASPDTEKTEGFAGMGALLFWPVTYAMELANLAAAQMRMSYEFQRLAYETGRTIVERQGEAIEDAVSENPQPAPVFLSAAADMREAGAAMMEAQLDTLRAMRASL